MRFNELRWSHFHALQVALGKGLLTPDAVAQAGISAAHWRRLRSDWRSVAGHLAEVDPAGAKADLVRIDSLIEQNRALGGRPKGAKDQARRARRHSLSKPLPTLRITDQSFYVEDGMAYIDE